MYSNIKFKLSFEGVCMPKNWELPSIANFNFKYNNKMKYTIKLQE